MDICDSWRALFNLLLLNFQFWPIFFIKKCCSLLQSWLTSCQTTWTTFGPQLAEHILMWKIIQQVLLCNSMFKMKVKNKHQKKMINFQIKMFQWIRGGLWNVFCLVIWRRGEAVYVVLPLQQWVRNTLSSCGMNTGGDCRQNNQSQQLLHALCNSVPCLLVNRILW